MLVTPPCDSDHPRGSRSTIMFDVRNIAIAPTTLAENLSW
jgi:hypothetical protein